MDVYDELDKNTLTFALPNPVSIVKYDDNTGYPLKLLIDDAVNYLIDNFNLKTIKETGEILYYENGVYKQQGETLIKELLNQAYNKVYTEDHEPIVNIKIVKEVIEKIKYMTMEDQNNFDRDLSIINMRNGLYNWKTGEFRPHDKNYLSVIQIPVKYDVNAECELIDEVMHDIVPKKYYDLLMEFLAYLLYRKYDIQKIIILYGKGSTGKSWYLRLCKEFVGDDNCSHETLYSLAENRFSPYNLNNKLLNECGDLDAKRLMNTGMLKMLASTDTISIEGKFKTAVDMENFAKLLFSTNILPETADDTSGFMRRFLTIHFNREFTPEEIATDHMRNRYVANRDQRELSGLFNKVISYLPALIKRNKFKNEPSYKEIRSLYKIVSNPINAFAEAYIYEDTKSFTPKEVMYNTYVAFCKEHKIEEPATRNVFSREILKYVNYIKSGSRVVNGVRTQSWINCSMI